MTSAAPPPATKPATRLDALLDAMQARKADPAAALAIYAAAPTDLAGDPLALYAAGTLRYELGQLTEAEAAFRAALAADPGNADFVVNLVTTLVSRARREPSRREAAAALANEALSLFASVAPSNRQRELEPVIEQLTAVVKSFPE